MKKRQIAKRISEKNRPCGNWLIVEEKSPINGYFYCRDTKTNARYHIHKRNLYIPKMISLIISEDIMQTLYRKTQYKKRIIGYPMPYMQHLNTPQWENIFKKRPDYIRFVSGYKCYECICHISSIVKVEYPESRMTYVRIYINDKVI